jgi:hypothetical protein
MQLESIFEIRPHVIEQSAQGAPPMIPRDVPMHVVPGPLDLILVK